jgi:hypothetical protein
MKYIYYSVGKFASDYCMYKVPEAIGNEVIPTGYFGWNDGRKTDRVTVGIGCGTNAIVINTLEQAKLHLRGEY